MLVFAPGLCHSHSDVSLAKDKDPHKDKDNSESALEKNSTFLFGSDDDIICKAIHSDDTNNFKVSCEALSDSSHVLCVNRNLSLSSVNSVQNLVTESSLSDNKENLVESTKDEPSSVGNVSDRITSPDDPLLSPPNCLGVFSFDDSECDFEKSVAFVWQQICEIDGVCGPETQVLEHSLGKLFDHSASNIPNRDLYSRNGKNLKDGSAGTQSVSTKASRKQLVPIEKSQYPTQVIASIRENTGKKRGRKKIYNSASCLEEEVILKRARNNEACGKYRTMKKKKLEQLFEEEKALNNDNSRLKAMCEQMEDEKKLLTNLMLSILKDKSYSNSTICKQNKSLLQN